MTDDLTIGIVRIVRPDGTTAGTGFVVTDDGLIATCSHVVQSEKSQRRGDPRPDYVDLVFHATGDCRRARVEPAWWRPADAEDVAILRLTSPLPEGVTSLPLGVSISSEDPAFKTFGFPKPNPVEGLRGSGSIVGETALKGMRVLQVRSQEVAHGMSGAPLWDVKAERIVGMVTSTYHTDATLKFRDLGFATPTEVLVEICPELARLLREPARSLGRLVNVPELPPHFLPRPEHLEPLKESVLADADVGRTVGITATTRKVGVQGMGGIGKSVLAAALARDEDVRRAFPDGVLWVTLGQELTLTLRQVQVAAALDDESPAFTDVQQGKARLSELLADRACLLILDDVWNARHAGAFDALGPRGRLLLTTRDARLLTALGASEHRLDVLDEDQTLRLLAKWTGIGQTADLPDQARDVARECGYLPLALAMAGTMVRGRPGRWENVLHRLRTADLEKIRQQFPDYPYPDLLRAIQVSVDALEPEVQARYLDFAVFPEDTPVPEAVLVTFWALEGLDEYDVQDLLDLLVDRSLAQRDAEGRLTLHDLQVDYVRKQASEEEAGLPARHDRLLGAYAACCRRSADGAPRWATGPRDGYFFPHLPYHLKEAGREGELRALLFNFEWLQAKLDATSVPTLSSDLSLLPHDVNLQLVHDALWLSAHVLTRQKKHLAEQLHGRLLSYQDPDIQAMLEQARQQKRTPWLRPMIPSLKAPDEDLRYTLAGHTLVVRSVVVTPDGKRAISGSADMTLVVWDLEQKTDLYSLEGHQDQIYAVALTPDGKCAVSASNDQTIMVWDLESRAGEAERILTGHEGPVRAVAVTPDGQRVVSSSTDGTIRVWDLLEGRDLPRRLPGHAGYDHALAVTPDGKSVLAALGSQVVVWDLEQGLKLQVLDGHTGDVAGLAVTPDGRRAVSASHDQTLKVWDLESGEALCTLQGHEDRVNGVAVTPDGRRAISASEDASLIVWDLESGEQLCRLVGHLEDVKAVAVTPDGKSAVSASSDMTLKVWDLKDRKGRRQRARFAPLPAMVRVMPDRRQALSVSDDHELVMWDLESRTALFRLAGHTDRVNQVAVVLEGQRAVSASEDQTLIVWDLEARSALFELTGHADGVYAVALTSDGRRAASVSRDGVIRLWDLEQGRELHTLPGRDPGIARLAIRPDGRRIVVVSHGGDIAVWDEESGANVISRPPDAGSWARPRRVSYVTAGGEWAIVSADDRHLKVVDLEHSTETHTLSCDYPVAVAVAVTPDGRRAIAVSLNNTLTRWDLEQEGELSFSTGHNRTVTGLAIGPNGRYAATVAGFGFGKMSGAPDRTLKVWDLDSGELVASFTGESALQDCIIVEDGVTFVAGPHILRLEGVESLKHRSNYQ